MYWGYHYWGMHMFWWIFWVVIISALLFWPAPRLLRRCDTALDTLRRRYASGEIDDEEYRHRLQILASGKAGPATTTSSSPPQQRSGSRSFAFPSTHRARLPSTPWCLF